MLWGWDWAIGNFRRQTYFPHPHPRLHKPPFFELNSQVNVENLFDLSPTAWCLTGGGGALQYQTDKGVRLTLPKAGAFGENTVSKNDRSLGEKPNFGSKLGGIGWECYFWSFSEHFKSRNLKKKNHRKWQKWSIKIVKGNLNLTENRLSWNEMCCASDNHNYMCHTCAKEFSNLSFNKAVIDKSINFSRYCQKFHIFT